MASIAIPLVELADTIVTELVETAVAESLATETIAETSIIEAGESVAYLSTDVSGTSISEQAVVEQITQETITETAESSILEDTYGAAEQSTYGTYGAATEQIEMSEEIETQHISEIVGWDDWLDVDAEMEDETIFTIPRQSTPIVEFDEDLTPSQRTTEIAKRFFERNSLITRPLRTLAGRVRSRMVMENIPSDIEMSDLIIQDKSLDEF